jgi:hypothetical protein
LSTLLVQIKGIYQGSQNSLALPSYHITQIQYLFVQAVKGSNCLERHFSSGQILAENPVS